MNHDKKRLLSYLLTVVMLVTALFGSAVSVSAAEVKLANGNAVDEYIDVDSGKNAYQLKQNITGGLVITLTDGETVILDGKNIYKLENNSSITTEGSFFTESVGLTVRGNGTLILRNIEILSTCAATYSDGINIQGDVNLILDGSVKSYGANGNYSDYPNGGNGISFTGKFFTMWKNAYPSFQGGQKSNNTDGNGADGEKMVFKQGLMDSSLSACTGITAGSNDRTFTVNEIYKGNKTKTDYLVRDIQSVELADIPLKILAQKNQIQWYTDPECVNQITENSVGINSNSMEIYARYRTYTVTFRTGDGSAVTPQDVEYGETAVKPADPARERYTFEGWYTDQDCTQSFDFSEEITGDMTLYAKWTKNKYTVTFQSNGGSDIKSQQVAYDEKAAEPTAPIREGYTFDGWYEDAGCTQLYDFSSKVTKNMTLYAKWTEKTYTVSFRTNGGSDTQPQTVTHGKTAAKPADPTREGYTFDGWFMDEPCTQAYDFNTEVTADMTLYAKWTERIPETEPETEPTTEPETEPTTEPETEPTTEPATEPTTEPTPAPIPEPAPAPTPEPAPAPETEAPITAEQIEKNSAVLNQNLFVTLKNGTMKVSWSGVPDADTYRIYAVECGKTLNGKTLAKTVTKNGKVSCTFTKLKGKKLNPNKIYKVKIRAYRTTDGVLQEIADSLILHVADTKNTKYTNAKSITVKKKSYTLEAGKKKTLKATVVPQSTKKKLIPESHTQQIRYFSSDRTVATVNKNGVVRARAQGTCYIYIAGMNGVHTKVKINVK